MQRATSAAAIGWKRVRPSPAMGSGKNGGVRRTSLASLTKKPSPGPKTRLERMMVWGTPLIAIACSPAHLLAR